MALSLQVATTDGILAWIKSPPSLFDQAAIVLEVLHCRRWSIVHRAVEEGALDPDAPISGARVRGVVKLIHAATMFSALPLVCFLIVDKRVDPNQEDMMGLTALHYAISHKAESILNFLLDKVPAININHSSKCGNVTPLMVAAARGSIPIMKALVSRGAEVDAVDDDGKTALAFASHASQEEAALWLLEEAGAAWDVVPREGLCVVVQAAALGQVRLVKAGIRRMRADGVDEALLAEHLADAAYTAIRYRKEISLKALEEEAGLDVVRTTMVKRHSADKRVLWRGGLLHRACLQGDEAVVHFLVERGCDVLGLDDDGYAPHHLAAWCGRLAVLKWLLATCPVIDVDMEARKGGVTALTLAAVHGHLQTVVWLIEQGADPLREYQEKPGGVPVRLSAAAEVRRHKAIAAYLRKQEAATEAVLRAEQEAAVRRARNDKRRQKQKKGKARQQQKQQQQATAGCGGETVEEVEEKGARSEADGGAATDYVDDRAVPSTEGVSGAMDKEEKATLKAVDGAGAIVFSSSIPPAPVVERPPPLKAYLDAHAPDDCRCPISMALLDDPVVLAGDGFTYSRAAIQEYFAFCRKRGGPLTSPKTNVKIDDAQAVLVPNFLVRGFVAAYAESKTREWEAAERRWREWAEGQGVKA